MGNGASMPPGVTEEDLAKASPEQIKAAKEMMQQKQKHDAPAPAIVFDPWFLPASSRSGVNHSQQAQWHRSGVNAANTHNDAGSVDDAANQHNVPGGDEVILMRPSECQCDLQELSNRVNFDQPTLRPAPKPAIRPADPMWCPEESIACSSSQTSMFQFNTPLSPYQSEAHLYQAQIQAFTAPTSRTPDVGPSKADPKKHPVSINPSSPIPHNLVVGSEHSLQGGFIKISQDSTKGSSGPLIPSKLKKSSGGDEFDEFFEDEDILLEAEELLSPSSIEHHGPKKLTNTGRVVLTDPEEVAGSSYRQTQEVAGSRATTGDEVMMFVA
eukprot:gene9189-16329_t